MSNPTSNFGWQMPTPTDLVTDLPADFEVFGQAVDSTMADLKGGTSGQILAKNSNTDMDFVWITNDQGDITGVTAGTGISGGGTSGTVTVTNSMATAIDAKGDLIAGTGADTFSRLAAGNNGETLVADSSTSTGLRYQGNFAAGKQILLNANFDIWQRGTSFASSGYMADRWQDGNSLGSVTASQQTSGAPVGSRYYLRYTSTAGSSYKNLMQLLETTQTMQYWGKTVTFSILLRRNATFNSGSVAIAIDKSVTNDASAAATWVNVGITNITLTSIPTGTTSADWYTASVTATIPSDGTANSLRVQFYYNNAQASGSIMDIAQPQLEVGSLRTAFQTATGTLQGELAACQRYYQRVTTAGGGGLVSSFNGIAYTTSACAFNLQPPVTMRATPTVIDASNLALLDTVGQNLVTAATISAASNASQSQMTFTVGGGTLVVQRSYFLGSHSSGAGFLGLGAEL